MEYSFEFAKRLIDAADLLGGKDSPGDETDRTVLYLSCLSCEISLKALLEKIGMEPRRIKTLSHDLSEILQTVSNCSSTVEDFRPSSIRAANVLPGTANGTVGTFLDSELLGGSRYPNEVRYGEAIRHYPPLAMLECAKVVNRWCEENWGNLTVEDAPDN